MTTLEKYSQSPLNSLAKTPFLFTFFIIAVISFGARQLKLIPNKLLDSMSMTTKHGGGTMSLTPPHTASTAIAAIVSDDSAKQTMILFSRRLALQPALSLPLVAQHLSPLAM